MKNLIVAVLLTAAAALPAKAAEWKPTFVSYSTFTAPGAGNYAWALRGGSSQYDVRVTRVDVGSCNDGTAVSGGLAQFELYGASSLTDGGTVQVSTGAYAGDAFPAGIQASTGPVNVAIEGKGDGSQNPLLPPFVVNDDETATSDFLQTYDLDSNNRQPIILPKGGTRAIVLKQKKVGTADITAGCVFARVEFTIR